MSRWFRHYAGMMRDDKLVRAAVLAKQPVERVVWVWGAILESAAEIDDGGRYDFDAAEAAYFLRADETDLRAILDSLAACGRVADGRVVKWGDRQYQSDRSASRQAAYRERKRASGSNSDDHKTSPERLVTSPSRHGDAPETETETDIKPDGLIGRGRATPAGVLSGVLDAEHAKAVVDHRQRIRKPLTPHAAKLLAGKFAQCPDPNAAADTMIANGWQGFEPSWLASRSTGPPVQRSVNGFAAVALALAEQDHDPGTHADFDPPSGGTAPRSGTERGNPQPRVLDTERPERAGGAYTVVDRR